MAVLLRNIGTLLTLQGAAHKQGRYVKEEDLSPILKASMIVDKGRIFWVGPDKKIPKEIAKKNLREVHLQGRTVLPGFVECHTHSVFAGNRAAEFEMRNLGASYSDIAAKGGGILSTMQKTRAASAKELITLAQQRVNRFVAQGVTTLEIKSGYGLDRASEIKVLEVVRKLKGPRLVSTFLGAHALPPEFSDYKDYLCYLSQEVLPLIKKKKLATRVDIFVEKGFFPVEESRAYLLQAQKMGFELALHADQLSLSGGADLAVELKALSGDHLIQVSPQQIKKLAQSQVTCVLLPAADLYMKCAYPPARDMIDAGARVALATDFNPGTSPTQDLNLVGLLARLQMKMSLPEVIAAYTLGAAYALGLASQVGSLEVGKSADFVCIECEWKELFYSIGQSPKPLVFIEGKQISNKLL